MLLLSPPRSTRGIVQTSWEVRESTPSTPPPSPRSPTEELSNLLPPLLAPKKWRGKESPRSSLSIFSYLLLLLLLQLLMLLSDLLLLSLVLFCFWRKVSVFCPLIDGWSKEEENVCWSQFKFQKVRWFLACLLSAKTEYLFLVQSVFIEWKRKIKSWHTCLICSPISSSSSTIFIIAVDLCRRGIIHAVVEFYFLKTKRRKKQRSELLCCCPKTKAKKMHNLYWMSSECRPSVSTQHCKTGDKRCFQFDKLSTITSETTCWLSQVPYGGESSYLNVGSIFWGKISAVCCILYTPRDDKFSRVPNNLTIRDDFIFLRRFVVLGMDSTLKKRFQYQWMHVEHKMEQNTTKSSKTIGGFVCY